MKVFYSPRYEVTLPGHIWPTSKYRLIAERLGVGDLGAVEFVEPAPASWDDLALVHTAEYLDKLRTSTLTPEDIATLELPWQPELADAFRLMVGGTMRRGGGRARRRARGASRRRAAPCVRESRRRVLPAERRRGRDSRPPA